MRITPAMAHRLNTGAYSYLSPCVICGKTFNGCPHDVHDTMRVIEEWRRMTVGQKELLLAAPLEPTPREEAIAFIKELCDTVAFEHSDADMTRETYEKTRAALLALGVTEDEIDV